MNESHSIRTAFDRFIHSAVFPLLFGATVLLGYAFKLEFYGNILLFCIVFLGLWLSDSPRPFLTLAFFFVFQVPLLHSPSFPYYSTYYFDTGKIVIIGILAVALVLSLIVYSVRTRMFSTVRKTGSPLFVPLLLLGAVFLLNGVGSSEYILENVIIGVVQLLVWVYFYFFLLAGFQKEKHDSLLNYLLECVFIQAWIILSEILLLFVENPAAMTDGVIDRSVFNFGWGTCNACGVCLTVLIPLCFYCFLQGKYRLFSLFTAVLCYLGSILTLSRNALLFGTLAVIGCFIVSISKKYKNHRKFFKIFTVIDILIVVALLIFFREPIHDLFVCILERGTESNGRIEIWRSAITSFTESPVFGKGFFGVQPELMAYVDFFPNFVHNTPLQFLGSAGAVGLLIYLFYRYRTARVLLQRKTLLRLCMTISICVFLGESLLDVFPFMIYPTFLYSALLAYAEVENKNAFVRENM